MTDDEKFYLAVAQEAFRNVVESGLPPLMTHVEPERGFLYLFDTAYAMGFAGARKMAADGIDIQALNPQTLSLIPRPK
jgi:hypothetical protein